MRKKLVQVYVQFFGNFTKLYGLSYHGSKSACPILMYFGALSKNKSIKRHFSGPYVGKQYVKVKFCAIPHALLKKSFLFVQFCAAGGFCQRIQNSRICQHCDVKTSRVTPTFYYLFIIFLTGCISVASFIYNLCQVLLLGNHLNKGFIQSK